MRRNIDEECTLRRNIDEGTLRRREEEGCVRRRRSSVKDLQRNEEDRQQVATTITSMENNLPTMILSRL